MTEQGQKIQDRNLLYAFPEGEELLLRKYLQRRLESDNASVAGSATHQKGLALSFDWTDNYESSQGNSYLTGSEALWNRMKLHSGSPHPLSCNKYTVGWICALPVETAAAKLMLDEIHHPLPRLSMDQNTYIFGSIGDHNVIIASLPSGAYGNTSAATVGMYFISCFHSIRIGFMVGVGGGVPSNNADIRLASQRPLLGACVIQYDLGKALRGSQFQRILMLNRPPKVLLTALTTLQAYHLTEDSRVLEYMSNIQGKLSPRKAKTFARPTQEDCLFQVEYDHVLSDTCINCDRSRLSPRHSRDHEEPAVHYGLIGSANQVVKDARLRDQLAQDLGVYCLEMEAAGLMNDFPCLVIRGICDYADSNKNKEWQGYAAAVTAAYAKELLLMVPIDQITSTPMARDALAESVPRFHIPLDLTDVPAIENLLGRQDELDQLWQYLQPTDSLSRKVAILHGLGGIGKTQLAIRFARDHKLDSTAIFWLSGKNRCTLFQSLSLIFPRLPGKSQSMEATNDEEVEQRARSVLRWLAFEENSRQLIVFDSVDQYSSVDSGVGDAYDIGEFFPTADHGAILITSRLQRLTELGRPFPINKLDSENTIELLLQSSRSSAKTFEINPGTDTHKTQTLLVVLICTETLALADRLYGLPLAIVIAGSFMRATGTSVAEYLQYYQESWADIQLQSSAGRHYQQGNMLQTWLISYHEIKKLRSGSYSSNVPVRLERATASGLTFKIAVRVLIEFSFLEVKSQERSYTMHPVSQDWCLHLASTERNVSSFQLIELLLVSIGHTIPHGSKRDCSTLQRRLTPHVNYAYKGNSSNIEIALWGAFHGLGDLYKDQGKLNVAEEIYQRALAGKEKAFVNNLGNIYSDQGKLKEAEGMYQRALAGYRKTFGLDHTFTLDVFNNLGTVYFDQEKLEEAEKMQGEDLGSYAHVDSPHCQKPSGKASKGRRDVPASAGRQRQIRNTHAPLEEGLALS
ncbi:hypothetical protein N7523_000037 [Penicillium sp. IBT 18751x]|nr:hypothetical protein N7523_000037 [Penicillium sp. IBT 18751x]